MQHNVLATSGRAVEAAGDVNTLLLDKTGTITIGNRQASEFVPALGVSKDQLADAAQLSSLPDETPEGRSIVVLAKELYGLRGRELGTTQRALRSLQRHNSYVRSRHGRPEYSQGSCRRDCTLSRTAWLITSCRGAGDC